jgi:hypothetical protein
MNIFKIFKTGGFWGVAACAATTFAAVKDCEFASIEYPEEWDPKSGKAFQVIVTPKESADGEDLSVHLHWMKLDGYGGFAGWQAPRKKIKAGKPYKFSFNPKGEHDYLHHFGACAFIAPNGDYSKKVKEQFVEIKVPPPPPYPERPECVTFKNSYIWIESNPPPTKVGEEVVLKVHYHLDPKDTWGPKQTKLMALPLGPWIDNPDGVINKRRHHVSYGGTMFRQEKKIDPGDGVVEFRFKLGTAYRYNGCFFLCKFKQPDGTEWPWDFRGGGLNVVPQNEYFRMYPTSRGGCFYYGETPNIALVWGDRAFGGMRKGKAVVRDCENRIVIEKEIDLNPARRVQSVSFPELKKRGVFSLTVTAPGLGLEGKDVDDFCYFATIPKFERIEGKDTPFGVTNIGDLDLSELAYDLGFSLVRHFVSWKGIQPARDRWLLKGLDRSIANNNAAGLKPWIQIFGPPAWTLPPGLNSTGTYEPAPFNLKDWEDTLLTLARRYKGKLYGFEFLNEIVPGNSCKDPVAEYVAICKTGYEALKKEDPSLVCQLAGGLWPHSYRIDCLKAGIAKYIDILPVHYSTFESVREAQNDLEVRGIKNVEVGDNETATGMSIWNYPPDMAFASSLKQCDYVMKRWPDVLCTGAKFVTYFGGGGDPCGNWSYMIDITSPRPVLATIAVVQGKLAYAKPVGKFFIGDTACHLFEKDGKSILFLSTAGKKDVKVKVPARGDLSITDYQGNVETLADNIVTTGDRPVIVEGGDLDQLKVYASLSVGTSISPVVLPQIVADKSEQVKLPVVLFNSYAKKVKFTVECKDVVGEAKPLVVELDPGMRHKDELVFEFKPGAKTPSILRLDATVSVDGIGRVSKPFSLCLTDESSLGNLVKNGTFDGDGAHWKGQGSIVELPVPGDAANSALAIAGKTQVSTGRHSGYSHHTQMTDLPVKGGTYLYTAWARGEGMGGGSNLDEYDETGRHLRNHIMLRVFSLGGKGTKGWSYLAKKMTFTPGTAKLAMTPVAKGKDGERIVFDNIQLSLYKGADYVAFASSDEAKSSAVPLLCENQIRPENGYEWSEKNIGGVAKFTWTKDALVFEAAVEDDALEAKPVVSESGMETLKGDSIALCLFPRMGPDGRPESDQIRWYISKASPGGGSGATTVFRPKAFSMGAKSGQLCKDSSVYQIDIKREGTLTTYRLRIPWSEIPGIAPTKGVSFGCNIVLGDSDGGEAFGSMIWGGGLKDDSADCGLVTLIP